MSVTRFSFPTAIHFGAGARALVGEHLRERNLKRPLIVTDRGLAALPVLAEFRKNTLWNLVRRRWLVRDAAGMLICRVLEDSIILSLLRRLVGSLFGILRTNFIFLASDGRVIGRLNRSFTLLDRYVLDLSFDPERTLDRRLAVAIGVMLDSGERR